MRLSKKAGYALRALTLMARRPGSWSIQELSDREHIPVKFLEQILLTLRHAGILSSKRGVGGGYTMVLPPNEVTVAEIVQALDGPFAPVPCAAERPTEKCTCPDPRSCPVRSVMTAFREEMVAWLRGRTLEDMARMAPDTTGLAFDI